MADLVNYLGKRIGYNPVFRKPEYWSGEYDDRGMPKPDWSLCINADSQGFDKSWKETNGTWRKKIILPKNTRLIRYGIEIGSFTAPAGTAFEELSLPYTKESLFYHEYEVIADGIIVTAFGRGSKRIKCEVERGKVAPGFDCPGGGIQYFHPYNMVQSINLKLLREII